MFVYACIHDVTTSWVRGARPPPAQTQDRRDIHPSEDVKLQRGSSLDIRQRNIMRRRRKKRTGEERRGVERERVNEWS